MPHLTSGSPESTSTATRPRQTDCRFVLFGGKGGVGKTTCAAGLAVAAARSGQRVLLVSTDPAHSLSDAVGAPVFSRPTNVAIGRSRLGALTAIELDASRAFARWLAENRRALGDILDHGTWLDSQDIDQLLNLSVPGIDELIGLVEVVRLASENSSTRQLSAEAESLRSRPRSLARGGGAPRASKYDLVVVDTAPTGHTLRLLASPDTVLAVAQVLDSLQDEHRMIRARFAASVRPEAADRLIDHLNDQARHTAALLRDAAGTSLRWVMLPERLSLAETEDALASLEAAGMRVSSIVVNRVVPPGPSCPTCDRRRIDEAWVIARLGRTVAKGRELRRVPALMREPRDVSALAAVGRALMGSRLVERGDVDQARPERPTGDARLLKSPRDNVRPRLHLESLRSARLLFFCGKGGAGKTTTASATAIALARDDAARRVLLLSIDPAHSLGDVFASRMSDAVATVDSSLPNLHVRELDAAAALEGRRAEIKEALQEIVARFGAGAVIAAGSRGVADLVDLAPPGIDELFGFVSVMQLLEANSYSVVVVDAAPTGHALRLLEMPDTARDWLHVLLRLLLKYRTLVRPGRLAAELLELSKAIRGLQRSLRDPLLARFIVVTRAARLPRLETDRLLKRLKRIGVSVPAALVNAATLTPGRCPRCRATAAAEARELAPLAVACRRAFRDCAIIQTPLVAPPPRGVKALEYWARQWMS